MSEKDGKTDVKNKIRFEELSYLFDFKVSILFFQPMCGSVQAIF